MSGKKRLEYYRLPVYNEVRKLTIQINASTQKLSKINKDVYLNPMLQYCLDAALNIYNITVETDSATIINIINTTLKNIKEVLLINRFMFDTKLIKQKGYNAIALHVQSIIRQLVGWGNSFQEEI